MHTRHNRDIIYDDVTILYTRNLLWIMAFVEPNLYGIAYVSIVPLCNLSIYHARTSRAINKDS